MRYQFCYIISTFSTIKLIYSHAPTVGLYLRQLHNTICVIGVAREVVSDLTDLNRGTFYNCRCPAIIPLIGLQGAAELSPTVGSAHCLSASGTICYSLAHACFGLTSFSFTSLTCAPDGFSLALAIFVCIAAIGLIFVCVA